MKALLVSEINAQIKSMLESTFVDIYMQGEISSVKIHTSGHIYLSLKDEYSSIKCVMFKGNARNLRIQLEVGQSVLVKGALSVYVPKGEYQILCRSITLAGAGEQAAAFEALKNKLHAQGYFDPIHKKPLPRFPKRIALLTSATGAAKEDMLKIAQKRWDKLEIVLFNTLVQGEGAKDSIVANILRADSGGFDVIVLGRGGGSMEDMWAFNEECVASAIFNAKTPIVSAVGHEVDVFISDFVADVRAPTPSAAMEILLPDKHEYLRLLDDLMSAFAQNFEIIFSKKVKEINHLGEYFALHNFERTYQNKSEQILYMRGIFDQNLEHKFDEFKQGCEHLETFLKLAQDRIMAHSEQEFENLIKAFELSSPEKLFAKGYAQVSVDSKPCRLKDIQVGESFTLSDIAQSIVARRIE